MKKGITFVLILAIFVVVYMLFSGDRENADIKRASHDIDVSRDISASSDTGISESTTHVADPQDYSVSNNNQKTQNEHTQSYKGQHLEPEIEAAVNELVNTSHEGLVEEKTDQGVGIDLKGRFRTAPVATIDDKGRIVVQDYTSAPGK